MTAHPCSALVGGVCANGFRVTRGCIPVEFVDPRGVPLGWTAPMPQCCDEEVEWPMRPSHNESPQRFSTKETDG